MSNPKVDKKRIDQDLEARASAFMKGVEQLCGRFPEFQTKLQDVLRELEHEERKVHEPVRQKR